MQLGLLSPLRLQQVSDACLQVQPSRDCVQKTLKRLEERIQGRVLKQVLYTLRSTDPVLQQRTATALARLAREQDLQQVFVECKGLDVLLNLFIDPSKTNDTHKEAACGCCALPCVSATFPAADLAVVTWPSCFCMVD